jgi:hypothetical protein
MCEDLLNEKNRSKEHILPNCIGGRLKSDRLLCRECNETTGVIFDDSFSDFSILWSSKYDIQRDRGKVPNFKAVAKNDGSELIVKPGWKIDFAHPVVRYLSDHQIIITSSSLVRTQQEVQRLNKDFIKKGFILDSIIDTQNPETKIDFVHDNVVNQDLVLRSVCKTFCNYYLYAGGDIRNINPIVKFLKQDIENYYSWFLDLNISNQIMEDTPFHIIVIKGDSKQSAVYGYFEIFGENGFVALLNGQYNGEDFEYNYIFNPVKNETISTSLDFRLNVGDIVQLLHVKPDYLGRSPVSSPQFNFQ